MSEDEVGSSVETGLVARDYLCVSGWPSVLDERHTDIYLLRHESMLTKHSSIVHFIAITPKIPNYKKFFF